MRKLPSSARGYLLFCYLLGSCALAWLLMSGPDAALSHEDWFLGAGLAIVAATCQVFIVASNRTSGKHSDHLTPAPLFAAVLLLPRPVLALVLIATWLPEWYIYRRLWYIQLFNIASYLIPAAIVRIAWFRLAGYDGFEDPFALSSLSVLHVLLAIPVFLGIQTFLLAMALKLARCQSFHESGLFAPSKLLVEVALVCMGITFAAAWLVDPLYGLTATLPLVVVFQALHVPNLMQAAATDPKTGLANMRHFNTLIARQLEYAARNEQPCSVLMCDLDYLRKINNTYGHQAGDTVLLGISDIIRRNLHDTDTAARFGGEEFAILLPNTSRSDAHQLAEQLRAACEAARFAVDPAVAPINITISIGAATLPFDGQTPEQLLREADLAVYQAKRDGRNQVVLAGWESRSLAGEWASEHFMPSTTSSLDVRRHVTAPLWEFIHQTTQVSTNKDGPGSQKLRSAAPVVSDQPTLSPQRARTKPAPTLRMLALIAVIVVAGLLSLLTDPTPDRLTWSSLGLFVIMTVLSESVAVDIGGRGKTSVAAILILSAALLYGAWGILATGLAFAVSVGIKAGSPFHRILFNFGMILLAAEGARWSFDVLVAGPVERMPFASLLLPALVAGLIYYAINHALVCLVRGLAEQRRPWQIWHADYRWLWPHYLVMGMLSLVVALGYLQFGPFGVIVLMTPVAMMHLAIKQYMDRSTVYVNELRRLNDQLAGSYESTLQALTRALDTRDEETEEHSQRVKRYTQLIATHLQIGKNEMEDIVRGALLHDIGKIGVPDAILLKSGPLTDDERALIRNHPEIGYSMIAHIPFLARAAQVVLHHHEAYDGSGYPSGLAGLNIPMGARIFAIADAYDAMTSDRPYRKALSHEVACDELQRCRGKQFDPSIVDTFLAIPHAELRAVQEEVLLFMEQSQRRAHERREGVDDIESLLVHGVGQPSASGDPHGWSGGFLRHSTISGSNG